MIFIVVLFGVPAVFLGMMNIYGLCAGLLNLIDNDPYFSAANWIVANWFIAMLVTLCGGLAYAAYTNM
jgi:hypothetical protein